jgi:hypothetical protein
MAMKGAGPDCPVRRMRPHPSLPIVEHFPVRPSDAARRGASDLAHRLLAAEPALSATKPFGPRVATGLGPGPGVFLEDHSWIALFAQRGDVAYSYRALLLAGDGDVVLVGIARNPAFEGYCRDHLGLGRPEILVPAPGPSRQSLALRAALDEALVARLAALARGAGGLNIIPYMGTGGAWVLAREIAEHAGVRVRVAAPPPRLTRRVNDKLWFAARVGELLGERALPPVREVHGLAVLSRQARALAEVHSSVVVKLPDSASSAGNIVLASAEVVGFSLKAIQERIRRLLRQAGWRGEFPLMVSAWEQPVIASPSVQLWIPLFGDGAPIIEGIFDQVLQGTAGAFVGAAPSAMPAALLDRLADEAGCLAGLFQALGYYGRCSFDAIIIGAPDGATVLHWIECNGRWGGVSIPMTLANRLLGDWARASFAVIESGELGGVGRRLGAVLRAVSDDLFVPRLKPRGAVVLSPTGIEQGSGFELMVIDHTAAAVRARADGVGEVFHRLVGGSP